MEDVARLSRCLVIFIPEAINFTEVGRYMEISPAF
jgi:hypothetical protein